MHYMPEMDDAEEGGVALFDQGRKSPKVDLPATLEHDIYEPPPLNGEDDSNLIQLHNNIAEDDGELTRFGGNVVAKNITRDNEDGTDLFQTDDIPVKNGGEITQFKGKWVANKDSEAASEIGMHGEDGTDLIQMDGGELTQFDGNKATKNVSTRDDNSKGAKNIDINIDGDNGNSDGVNDSNMATRASTETLSETDDSFHTAPSSSDDEGLDLTQQSPEVREAFYRATFSSVITYEDMDEPALCGMYPTLNDEIWDAYFRHTIFTVKIWTNYDHIAQKFYCHARGNSCGTLRFKSGNEAATLQYLKASGRDTVKISKLRLVIGSAWRNFLAIDLEVVQSTTEEGTAVVRIKDWQPDSQHPALTFSWGFRDFIHEVMFDAIDGFQLPLGQDGITLREIIGIAEGFKNYPDQEGKYRDKDESGHWKRNIRYDGYYMLEGMVSGRDL